MNRPYRLTTLGSVDLQDAEGARVLSILAQPKRLALLTYLAVEGRNGPVTRDAACALFWPHLDQERARSNLRNGLYFLRRSLGADLVDAIGDEQLILVEGLVECDAAIALVSGVQPSAGPDFLPGFHVSGTGPEFDRWRASVGRDVEELPAAATQPSSSVVDAQPRAGATPPTREPQPRRRLVGPVVGLAVLATGALLVSFGSSSQADGGFVQTLVREASLKDFAGSREANVEAVALLRQAIQLDDSSAAAYSGLAMAYGARSIFNGFAESWADSAAEAAQRAVSLDSADVEAWSALSFSRFQQSRYQESIVAGLRVLEADPSQHLLLNNLGFISFYRGDYVDAVRWAMRAVEARPDWAPPRTLIGLTLAEMGENELALAWLDSAHEVQPGWPPTRAFVVQVHLAAGHIDQAVEAAEGLLAIGPRSPVNIMAAVEVELARGDVERSAQLLRELYSRTPDFMPPFGLSARTRLGLILLRLGEVEEARELMTAASAIAQTEVESGNESKSYRLELAAIEEALGNSQNALAWLDEAYRLGWRELRLAVALKPGLDPMDERGDLDDLKVRLEGDAESAKRRLLADDLVRGPGH